MTDLPDLRALSADTFRPHLESTFQLTIGEHRVDARLIDVVGHQGDTVEDAQRAPFSVLFRCAPDVTFEQQLVGLSHDTLGEMALFLVPVGPDQEGTRYEAVFS